ATTTVDAGTSVQLVVVPLKVPGPPTVTSTAFDALADTLSIRATGGGGVIDETHVVSLHESANGAVLSFNPNALSFSGGGQKSFNVHNAGTLKADVTLTETGNHFSVSPLTNTALAGGDANESATYTRPLLGGTFNATIKVT